VCFPPIGANGDRSSAILSKKPHAISGHGFPWEVACTTKRFADHRRIFCHHWYEISGFDIIEPIDFLLVSDGNIDLTNHAHGNSTRVIMTHSHVPVSAKVVARFLLAGRYLNFS
jgi:hypothetical protein